MHIVPLWPDPRKVHEAALGVSTEPMMPGTVVPYRMPGAFKASEDGGRTAGPSRGGGGTGGSPRLGRGRQLTMAWFEKDSLPGGRFR